MLRKLFAAICVVTILTSAANAAIIGAATLIKNPAGGVAFGAPDAALPAPWQSYVLSLTANAGETIQAIEAVISGGLHQRWDDNDFDGDPTNNPTGNSTSAVQANGDSHLLAPTGSLFGSGPTENNPASGSPLANPDPTSRIYGVGNLLQGAWALTGASAGSMANVAYLVIDPNAIASLNIAVKVANPVGETLAQLTKADFPGLPGPIIDQNTPPVVDDLGPLVGDMSLNGPGVPTLVSGTLPATDNQLPGVPLAWAFDGAPVGPGAPVHPATLNPGTGLFSWDVDGSKGGLYQFTIRGTDNGLPGSGGPLSDTGILSVQVIVPEPASMTLFGLALVGLVGLIRRRG